MLSLQSISIFRLTFLLAGNLPDWQHKQGIFYCITCTASTNPWCAATFNAVCPCLSTSSRSNASQDLRNVFRRLILFSAHNLCRTDWFLESNIVMRDTGVSEQGVSDTSFVWGEENIHTIRKIMQVNKEDTFNIRKM